MNYSNDHGKALKLEVLELARECIENGQEIPADFSRILFPPEKREYELLYWGKESKQEILSNIIPIPLQSDRLFPPNSIYREGDWINKLVLERICKF